MKEKMKCDQNTKKLVGMVQVKGRWMNRASELGVMLLEGIAMRVSSWERNIGMLLRAPW